MLVGARAAAVRGGVARGAERRALHVTAAAAGFVGTRSKNAKNPFGKGRKRNRSALFKPSPASSAFPLSVITPHDELMFERYMERVEIARVMAEKQGDDAVSFDGSGEMAEAAPVRTSVFDKDPETLAKERRAAEKQMRKDKKRKGKKAGSGNGRKGNWAKRELTKEELAFLE
jgi:hypothetical protein